MILKCSRPAQIMRPMLSTMPSMLVKLPQKAIQLTALTTTCYQESMKDGMSSQKEPTALLVLLFGFTTTVPST